MIAKKLFFIALTFLLVLAAVNVVAAVNSTVDSTGLNSQQASSASPGNMVVWCDNRDGSGTSHVYYKNLETGAGSRISWVNSQQTNPVISGNTVVWTDNRDGAGTSHLYYKNIATGVGTRVSWVNSQQTNAAISGNTVVWTDNRDGAGTSHLYYKNLVTSAGSRVSWVNSDQESPSISGSIVAWQDSRDGGCHVYYKNLDTKAGSRISWVNSQQTNAAVSGTTVVWQDNRDGKDHVYYKNIATGAGTRISWVDSHQYHPAISGDTIVWEDDRDAYTNHLYYKNIATGAASRVSWVNSIQYNPAIYGNTVVWEDNRNGGNHLYYKNIATGAGTRASWVNSQQTNSAINFAGYNINEPSSTAKLIFIHHSSGGNWLSNGNGNLGATLNSNNYYVSETDYGWSAEPGDNLGDRTNTDNWPEWFTDAKMPYVYANNYHSAYTNTISNPGGENEIIMFKSCYPLSEVGDSIADEKAIYNSLKTYFAAHPEKLFILITPPGETDVESYLLTRQLCDWLVDRENGWLKGYTGKNVFAFDFYGVLSEVNSHHRYNAGNIEHVYASNYDGTSPYHDGDNHPNAAGNQKATSEYINLLNIVYNQWKL